MTPSLPRKCSTPEPRGLDLFSGRGSEPAPAGFRAFDCLRFCSVGHGTEAKPHRTCPLSAEMHPEMSPRTVSSEPSLVYKKSHMLRMPKHQMERETGFEPATNSLEGCDSTPELLPLATAAGARSTGEIDGGGGWIRTTVGLRRQIYSLLPLSTRPHLLNSTICQRTVGPNHASEFKPC